MAWTYLVLAAIFEIGFALTLKLSEGFTKLWPSLIFLVCFASSFLLLAKAAQTLPIGTAYAVWTGAGAAGAVVFGILVFNEPATTLRMICLSTLIASIIGLRLASPA
jgi:quaternary ammonium compound-resistance protein SugE